jgi:hypothetical protein
VVLQETILGNTDFLESSEPGHQLQELEYNGGATPSCTSETLNLVVAVAPLRMPGWHLRPAGDAAACSPNSEAYRVPHIQHHQGTRFTMYDNTLQPFSLRYFDSLHSRTLLFALIIQYALSTQGHGHVNPVHAREALRHATADESRARTGSLQQDGCRRHYDYFSTFSWL